MSKKKITDLQVVEAKMIADAMLDDLLSNLHDVEKTNRGVQAFIHLMSIMPTLARMTTGFLRRIERDHSYLSKCSNFQKRILLFVMLQSIMVGEDIEAKFSSKNQSPLETTLVRLCDVACAFENETVPEEFCGIWMQTVKQAIIMFLKNNQPVEASKILVLYRDKIVQDHLQLLENMIKVCTENENFIEQWSNEEGHEYSAYYDLAADFMEDLNSQVEATALHKIATKINMSITHNESDTDGMESDDHHVPESDPNSSMGESSTDEPPSDSKKQRLNETFNKHKIVQELQESDSNSSIDDGNTVKPVRQQAKVPRDDIDFVQPSTSKTKRLTHSDKNDSVVDTHLSPKMSLAYRLKKQSHTSGIITPCKHIVDHCRKVNNELREETVKKQGPSVSKKHKMPIPITSATLARSLYNPQISPRNFLLGERFEDINTTTATASSRYSSKTKLTFNIELDSFIVAGCQRFGVGQWAKTLTAFPFPPKCTNVKLKDRFRSLIKLKHVGILDDGDIVILNKELKNRVQKVKSKKILGRDNEFASDENKNVKHSSKKKNVEPGKATSRVDLLSTSPAGTKQKPTKSPEQPGHAVVKFTPLEDAYLLCGAKHLGLRWDSLLEYFDFNENTTASDMQKRWETLIKLGKISENDGELVCEDEDLQKKSREVTNKLKQRIQNQRKKFATPSSDGVNSESNQSSEILIKPVRRRKYIVDNSSSEEAGLNQSVKAKSNKTDALNTSIDVGTQTIRSKVLLRNNSPSILEASSSTASRSDTSVSVDKKSNPVGSPTRPSVINLFKRQRDQKKNKHKKEQNSILKDMRERRQRVIMRMHRRNATPVRNPWKDSEIKELLNGLSKHGPGKWAEILDDGWDVFNNRTSVMIKDKYRNMLKSKSIPEDLISSWNDRNTTKG